MPVKPRDLAELQSAALVVAHVAHFSSEPEDSVLPTVIQRPFFHRSPGPTFWVRC